MRTFGSVLLLLCLGVHVAHASSCQLAEALSNAEWAPQGGSVLQSSICIFPDGRTSTEDAVLDGTGVYVGLLFSSLYQIYGPPSIGCTLQFLDAGLDFSYAGGNIVLCGGGQLFAPCEFLPCELGAYAISGGGHSPVDSSGHPYGSIRVIWVPDDCQHGCAQKYIELYVNSPDINGDLVVNGSDGGFFNADLFGDYNYRSDFNFDGVVNLSDAGVMTGAIGTSCAP